MDDFNEKIDVVEARNLIEIVTKLAKACAFTKLESMKIASVCKGCVDRIEKESE